MERCGAGGGPERRQMKMTFSASSNLLIMYYKFDLISGLFFFLFFSFLFDDDS